MIAQSYEKPITSRLIVDIITINYMFRKALSTITGISFAPYFLDGNTQSSERNGICILYPDNSSNVRGVVSFSQQNLLAPTKIACSVKGLTPNNKHGIHIHEYGDLTEGCKTAGPHFNPHGKKHGGPLNEERHIGDLGNLIADPFGYSYLCFIDNKISLFGELSIIGRSVVIHANEDDLGQKGDQQSLKTGNAGPRVACGIIGISKDFKTVTPTISK